MDIMEFNREPVEEPMPEEQMLLLLPMLLLLDEEWGSG